MAFLMVDRNQFGSVEYLCDDYIDLADIPSLLGREVYVINTGNKYKSNSNGDWEPVPTSGSSGATSYNDLTNKPLVNGYTLTGNKSSIELGLQPAGDYALTDDLTAEVQARISADNAIMEYVDDKTLLLIAINLFLKVSNTMNQIKPTGNGTVVASANSLTTTDRLLFTFNYTAPQDFLLLASNRYMFNIPLQSMSSGRNIINRYVYTVGGNVVCDVTRPQFTVPSNGMFTDSFEIVNNLPNDIVIPNGATITLQIYGRTTSSSSGMAMLVNDQDNMARVSRNEITAGQSATNIYTIARGFLETQESFNYYVFTELSNLMNQ